MQREGATTTLVTGQAVGCYAGAMPDWLTWEGARRFGGLALAVVGRRLLPFAKRVRAERDAATEGLVPPDAFGAAIDEVVARLTGDPRNDAAFETVAVRAGHAVVATGVLRKPAVREWLRRPYVAADLRRAARLSVLHPTAPATAPTDETLAAFEEATGEHRRRGEDAFDQVVGVVVASVRSAQGLDSTITVAANELQADRVVGRIDRLEDRLAAPPTLVAAGSATLAECADAALIRTLARRFVVPPDETRRALRALDARMEHGDLRGAPSAVRARVLWWAARFAASDPDSEYDNLIARASALDPHADFGLHEALRLDTFGRHDDALKQLRDRDDPDARSIILILLGKAGRRSDALDWLGNLNALAPSCFTGMGWRALGVFLMDEGRYAEAAQVLARCTPEHEAECPDILYVRGLASAASQYPAFVRKAFSSGGVPTGVARLEGPEADAAHDAAVRDLERSNDALRSVGLDERGRHAHVCALSLRLDRHATREAALADIARELAQATTPSFDLVRLALEHGVNFDREVVEASLVRAERLGELRGAEVDAKLALLQNRGPAELAAYLEANEAFLRDYLPAAVLAGLHVESLARSSDPVRARQVLDAARDILADDYLRLTALIDAHSGLDPTEALAALARRTGDPVDLMNLCAALERAGNWAALAEPAADLLSLIPNTENLLRVVRTLSHSRVPGADVLAVLSEHPALVQADRRLSLERVQALLDAGEVVEAAAAAGDLYATHGGADEAALVCNASILSGDWLTLRDIAVQELGRRTERSPAHLSWIALVCSEQDENAALALAREAALREDAGPTTLLQCAGVALRAGEDEEAFGWIRRAHEMSGEDGPVRTVDRAEALSFFVERAEQNRSIERMLSSGQVPLHLAAHALGTGLVPLLLHNLMRNPRQRDGRTRSVLPLWPGSRGLTSISEVHRPIVDFTSLLVLAQLRALHLLDENFEQLVIPWSTMVLLLKETDRLRHHQRSKVRQAERLRALLADGVLCRIPPRRGRVNPAIEREVGFELAQLLALAEESGGRVVHTAAVSRVGLERDDAARLGELASTILTTRQFTDMLRAQGALDEERYATVSAVLAQHDANPAPGPGDVRGPLYVSWLGAAYLEPLGLLNALRGAGLTAFVSDEIAEGALTHAEYEADAREIAETLRRLRSWYANGIAANRIVVAPRLREVRGQDGDDVEQEPDILFILREFLAISRCDGAVADDRHLLRHANVGKAGRTVPLFGTLDLLQHLAGGQGLSNERHWALRHQLRAGGGVCVPLDVVELQHHLVHFADVQSGESAELRAIRESIAALQVRDTLALPEEEPFLSSLLLTACMTIRKLWADEQIPIEVAQMRADWTWEHVAPKGPAWWHRLGEEDRPDPSPECLRAPLALLLPLFAKGQERKSAARTWLEERLLAPWWADPGFRQLAVDIARARIVELSTNFEPELPRRATAEELLEQLPSTISRALRGDAAFLKAVDLQNHLPLVGIVPDLVFALPAMRTAARAALNGQPSQLRDLRHRREVEFDRRDGRVVLRWKANGETREQDAPIDLTLFSPHRTERLQTFDQMVAAAGPSGPDPMVWRPLLETAAPSDDDADSILALMSNSVPSQTSRIVAALSKGVLDLTVIAPAEPTYWQGLCGSAPGPAPQGEWIATVWTPRANRLIESFGAAGFRLIAAANAMPGLVTATSPPAVEVLLELEPEASSNWGPLALVGLAEAAGAHAEISAEATALMRRVTGQIVDRLTADDGAVRESIDVFAGLIRLIGTALAASPSMAGQPPWWIRLCAFAQAEVLLAPVLAMEPELPEFLNAMEKLCPAAGFWAELLSLQEEPLWRSEVETATWLRAEALGRVNLLLTAKNEATKLQEVRTAAWNVGLAMAYPWAAISPGPLECLALPDASVEVEPTLLETVDAALGELRKESPAPGAWRLLDMASRHVHYGEERLSQLATIAASWEPADTASLDQWTPLLHLARIAASQQDGLLGGAVLQTLRGTPAAADDAGAALQIALAASATSRSTTEGLKRFSDFALVLAWRATPSGCAEVEAALTSISELLPVSTAWHLALPRTIAGLGARARSN